MHLNTPTCCSYLITFQKKKFKGKELLINYNQSHVVTLDEYLKIRQKKIKILIKQKKRKRRSKVNVDSHNIVG